MYMYIYVMQLMHYIISWYQRKLTKIRDELSYLNYCTRLFKPRRRQLVVVLLYNLTFVLERIQILFKADDEVNLRNCPLFPLLLFLFSNQSIN